MINTELKQIHDDAKALFARAIRLSRKLKAQQEANEKAKREGDPLASLRSPTHDADEIAAECAARRIWDCVEVIAQRIGMDEAIKGEPK